MDASAASLSGPVLDCPTGFAAVSARHLGMSGSEPVLLGRMAAQINRRPKAGDRCIVVAWPTGRDGRKLFCPTARCWEPTERRWPSRKRPG